MKAKKKLSDTASKKGKTPEKVSDIVGKDANDTKSKPQLYETNYNKKKTKS